MVSSRQRRYRRSPFLLLLWSDCELHLLDCNSLQRFRIKPDLLPILSRLGEATSPRELEAGGFSIDGDTLDYLRRHGIVEIAGKMEKRADGAFWDPLELAVHRRTATGGYYPELAGRQPPPSNELRYANCPQIALPRPRRMRAVDLADVLRRRRSLRAYSGRSMRLTTLSTLLHHAARVQAVIPSSGGNVILRPFPTAGARSELEIYIVNFNCSRLECGTYYYDPFHHVLRKVIGPDAHQLEMLRSINSAMGGHLTGTPSAVFIITAVFGRIMSKYTNLGLSLIYKDVGGLLQTLHLVATALGLAGCAIGASQEAENSDFLKLDPLLESQVGCFVLGPVQEASLAASRS